MLQGVTRVTEGYKELQELKVGYKGLQEDSNDYNRLLGVTRVTRG